MEAIEIVVVAPNPVTEAVVISEETGNVVEVSDTDGQIVVVAPQLTTEIVVVSEETGNVVEVSDIIRGSGSGSDVDKEQPLGSINGVNTEFLLAYPPITNSEHLYLNGLLQEAFEHYEVGGQTLTFDEPPQTGDRIRCSYRKWNYE